MKTDLEEYGKVIENVEIKTLTTYKVGGIAKYVIYPYDVDRLIDLMHYLKNNNIKHKVIGNGSNLIFSDNLYDGVLIKLSNFDKVKFYYNKIDVEAGFSLPKLCQMAAKKSLTGLEFASGIPGTIGGAIYMNAGAYKSDMGYIVVDVRVLTPDYRIITLVNKELDYHYRSSFFQTHKGYIILDATIRLKKGKRELIEEVMEDRRRRRIETQPLEYPCAGSVFRNPENNFAGKLIEDLNLKGYTIGGAKISEKHANFIINYNNATGEDVKKLIELIQNKVEKKYNIKLHLEQELVNWEK